MKIGIAITTYNRKENVTKQIKLIKSLSAGNIEIVLCDDGSNDNTCDLNEEEGVTVIGKINKGIAWNKNRGIFFLFNYKKVDTVILMDDDVMPTTYGWNLEWHEAAMAYGHVNYVPPEMEHYVIGGGLTAINVGASPMVGGMCMAISKEAFTHVGYMDIRFGRYGHEHSDYSFRYIRSSYGGYVLKTHDKKMTYFFVIRGGVSLAHLPSTGSHEEAQKNLDVLAKVANDAVYRLPWITDEEKKDFLEEFSCFSTRTTPEIELIGKTFDAEKYLSKNPDVQKARLAPLTHYMVFGKNEGREV